MKTNFYEIAYTATYGTPYLTRQGKVIAHILKNGQLQTPHSPPQGKLYTHANKKATPAYIVQTLKKFNIHF